jgi:hypothetical protein
LHEIIENRGVTYDADVVDACVSLFATGRFHFKEEVGGVQTTQF